ncbi:MAG TPA: cation-translocating P-type ATPase [Burkholderiaceae bacterium]|nr:cation-translocating P-type ATPase [Burkholderiaceae bacterium]
MTQPAAVRLPVPLPGACAPEGVAAGVALLDDPAQWGGFGRALDSGAWESHVVIDGMHCAACALNIEDALARVDGVRAAEVSSANRRARVVWDSAVAQPSDWIGAIARAGYRAVPARDAYLRAARLRERRRALWRWLVATLCMMQVMMYATPAYVAGPGDMTPDMEQLLRWASWVLTLPVILFSCGPFFSNAWRDLRQRRVSMDLPVALGILITFAVSTAGTFEPNGPFGHEVYFDSLTMFVFFLLGGRWLELRLQDRTAGALDALMNQLPESVERRRADGGVETVGLAQLRAGDQVQVLPGQAFPGDGTVIEGSTEADEALLTGESRPVPRPLGAQVVAGSFNLASPVWVSLARVGEGTRYAEIVALMESAATSRPSIAALADRVARPFLVAVLVAAALAGAYWWPSYPARALMVAVAVLIVTCPCALSLATPAALLAAAGNLARGGVLPRHLDALERLARVDTVVFDKTGTLTEDRLTLTRTVLREGAALSEDQALALAAALARRSLHPVSRALVNEALARALGLAEAGATRELAGQGIEAVLDGGRALRLGSPAFCGALDQAGSDALVVCLADGEGWLAVFHLREALRPDAAQAVAALRAQGVQVRLLSGDAGAAVERVARELGIAHWRAGCTPADKLEAIRALQAQGHVVAMAGDGINDAPVLAGADLSFAMGHGAPLARARADIVSLSSRVGGVADALALARRAMQVVRQNLWWAVAYNAVSVPLAVVGWMPAWLAGIGMAASSLLVVSNALRLSRRTASPAAGSH